jgi:hypothetical protein
MTVEEKNGILINRINHLIDLALLKGELTREQRLKIRQDQKVINEYLEACKNMQKRNFDLKKVAQLFEEKQLFEDDDIVDLTDSIKVTKAEEYLYSCIKSSIYMIIYSNTI